MRNDIASTLAGVTPRVWRFPGGNNVEGPNLANRWIWNHTIGLWLFELRKRFVRDS
jgi:alpha-L-arabinofuranosidase